MTTHEILTAPKQATFVAKRHWHRDAWFYVSEIPGKGGKDWGYTAFADKAIPLSTQQARRFRAHCRHVGALVSIVPATH